jgi:hypothetical protein
MDSPSYTRDRAPRVDPRDNPMVPLVSKTTTIGNTLGIPLITIIQGYTLGYTLGSNK